MKKILTWIGAVLIIVLGIMLAKSFTPDKNPVLLIQQYGGEQAKWVTSREGLKIHYRDQGPKDAPALVMVHGMSAHLQTWEPLIETMGEGYRYVSLDLPGHGLTGPHPKHDYSSRSLQAAVIAVMDELAIDKATIVGNSMGGWTAWRMGVSYPDRINGLVLIDPWGAPGKATEKSNIGFKLMQTPIGAALLPKFTPRVLVKKSVLQSVEREEIVTQDMVNRYHDLIRFPGNREAAIHAVRRDDEMEAWADVGSITAPVLILWGRQDQLIDVSRAQSFKDAIPGSELIIYDDVGHLPMEEVPALVARDIKAWLTE